MMKDRLTITLRAVATAIMVCALSGAAAAAELVMLERDGCEWCAKWDAVIAPIYPKSEEGKRAPLRRVDINRPMPEDLAGLRPAKFTPTFILMEDGKEIGRIRGYPGEDFFWGLLRELVAKLPPDATKTVDCRYSSRRIQERRPETNQ